MQLAASVLVRLLAAARFDPVLAALLAAAVLVALVAAAKAYPWPQSPQFAG